MIFFYYCPFIVALALLGAAIIFFVHGDDPDVYDYVPEYTDDEIVAADEADAVLAADDDEDY